MWIEDYNGFEIWEHQPYEGYTKYPIVLRYYDRDVDNYETVEAAKREVDAMPEWLERLMHEVDTEG